ncbi:cytidine deaminase-like protein [Cokeromyces recurvatus]|uniref:cytidine deaminase-like protein n=1 Tax=Cokeromyces recurvatus TaxID=90255 RepID=UPI00221EF94A|nr:cytidine deaminase-like protein [Cokeromyces recurvatus]KAI7899294.1 cytidine deaminase-like protein [Cokeromyces recurvatus]
MFIGITGSQSSGKHTIAQYLVEQHHFQLLTLSSFTNTAGREHLYSNAIQFENVNKMQRYVTERWQEDFVTCDVDSRELWTLKKRPFFLLISVEAPVTLRYKRWIERCQIEDRPPADLETFLIKDDRDLYNISEKDQHEINTITPLHNIMIASDLVITNIYSDKSSLYKELKRRNLTDKERLRPSWDTYFMQLSDLAARRSNCMKRRVGCILVKDSRVIATGYNGTPRGLRNCNEGGCGRCNEGAPCGTGLDRCLCMHAEENALLEAGRGSNVALDNGVILYCNTCPCLGCAIKIIQQGVKEVVYSLSYGMDQMTAKVFEEANVKLRQHSALSMPVELRTGIDEEVLLLNLK